MKKISILLLISMLYFLPCTAFSKEIKETPKIFTYHIPDEDDAEEKVSMPQENHDIISDDVTADTSCDVITVDNNNSHLEDDEDYLLGNLYTDVLHGYASYDETEEEEGINLNPNLKILTLNIHSPYKIGIKNFSGLKTGESLYENIYTKYNGTEYAIAPVYNKHTSKNYKGFSAGTSYEQEISSGELEQTSGVFSRYEYKRFALTTSYSKTVNSTNNNYNDKFAITPELKLNQYLTLKNKFSADTVKKRKKAEVILSVNPFGKKDFDRLRFDFSASETYDEVSNSFWNRFEVNTTFKL